MRSLKSNPDARSGYEGEKERQALARREVRERSIGERGLSAPDEAHFRAHFEQKVTEGRRMGIYRIGLIGPISSDVFFDNKPTSSDTR